MLAHLILIALTLVFTLALLGVTKRFLVVAPLAAVATAVCYSLFARWQAGYWDKFATIAFFVLIAYSFLLSLLMLWGGRQLKLSPFLLKESAGNGADQSSNP